MDIQSPLVIPDGTSILTIHAAHIISHHYVSKTPSNSSAASSSSSLKNGVGGSSSSLKKGSLKSSSPSLSKTKGNVISKRRSSDTVVKSPQLVEHKISAEEKSGTWAWEALCMFAGAREQLGKLLDGKSGGRHYVDQTYNGLLLHGDVHNLFDKLHGWLEHLVLDYFLKSLT